MLPKGSPVKSILDGVVISADWSENTGNTICIQHANNLVSIYKHNSSLSKDLGDQVIKGEVIAIVGNSGHLSTGPHAHFEIWHNGQAFNPENLIEFD